MVQRRIARRVAVAALLAAGLWLAGCDPKRISELEEGVSTEAHVRARFGEPENIWDSPAGRVFEYNRQPQGQKNYMITIGPDGKMAALRQVLTPENFARVRPGMAMEDLRKLLGKPARRTPYPLKNETAWEWRWVQPPNSPMVFIATLNDDQRVVSAGSSPDRSTEANAN
ncbi:outer membrane protein assembly factor BamE [Variovorax sp. WS11]|uniref:outer membrane protein assembly factor BamE n=1 Tax=Variovorax sp. WS11 TaxID=1105204 RepID=UPI000D0D3698|nr:outer membrane protein assembly factor BamE [Variovorax sp. WS11]NDZ16191.1 outer membrane protein assembly factor BamE [Variovorax sp. WS11]PSL83980.1 outer membrane protein assembly factor BamE [Variovorax sp. WS11]